MTGAAGVLAAVSVIAWAMAGRPSATARARLALIEGGAHARSASLQPRASLGVAVTAAGVAFGVVAGGRFGPVGRVAAAVGVVLAARHLRRRAASHRRQRLARQIPEAARLMAAALKAGRSIRQALPEAAALGPPLGPVVDRAVATLALGRPLGAALDDLAAAEPSLGAITAALQIGARAGGDVARALERLAEVAETRIHGAGELAALTAQVRFSAAILGALPLLALALLSRSAASSGFFREGVGQACLAAGLVLDLAGAALLRRLGSGGAP